ncbi:MAG: hypothetical protein QGF46_05850, partial [Planctomycetota bacterium]|nr:hypothetical protein [Planctomycetota bacterium]
INGAWIEGTPSQRDLSTAEKIKSIRSKQSESKVAIHFGDWHLAPQHLPQQLSRLGMDATCVHLSPRPLWDLQRRRIFDDVVKLENQHWAWMRTPPLANTSAFMLEYSAANADEYCEESACLVETAANQLAKFLNVPTPYSAFEIYLDHDWDSFQNLLSNEGSRVMPTKPNIPVCHPTLGLMWTPQDVDAHHIVQGAAHLVYCENFQTGDAFTDLFRSYVFRFLCTLSVNPFFKLATCGDDNEHQWVMRGAFRVAKELNQDNNASVGKLLSSFKHVELWDYELQALRDTIKVA